VPAEAKAPSTAPPTSPAPKLSGIEVAAPTQKSASAAEEVKASDCIATGSKSSCRTSPVPTQPSGTSRPSAAAPASLPRPAPERAATASAAAAPSAVQRSAPPGQPPSEAAAPSGSVASPSQSRSGASTPRIVASAVSAKTRITSAARRLPVPDRTTRREMQPRVSTMPAPNSAPPSKIAATGRSPAWKR